jgi:hypothetical protein
MGKRDASAVLGHLAAGRRPPRRPVIAGAAPPKMPVEEFKQREVHDAARAEWTFMEITYEPSRTVFSVPGLLYTSVARARHVVFTPCTPRSR